MGNDKQNSSPNLDFCGEIVKPLPKRQPECAELSVWSQGNREPNKYCLGDAIC